MISAIHCIWITVSVSRIDGKGGAFDTCGPSVHRNLKTCIGHRRFEKSIDRARNTFRNNVAGIRPSFTGEHHCASVRRTCLSSSSDISDRDTICILLNRG